MAQKTVYFLGAGATKAAAEGAPLNDDLIKKALERFPREGRAIVEVARKVFKSRRNPPLDNNLWNLFDYAVQQGRGPSKEYSLETIKELRQKLLELAIREFQESLRQPEQETYRRFSRILYRSHPVSVLSTNYDIIVDNALEGHIRNYGGMIRYTISSNDKVGGMLRGIPRGSPVEVEWNQGNVLILKLHGSLNWLYCRKCNEVDLTVGEKGVVGALAGLQCANRACTNQYEPLLITPTMFKNYDNRFIQDVWRYAEQELIEAEQLYFIGYALKEDDYQIRCLLMKAMLNKQGRYKRVLVVDKMMNANGNSAKQLKKRFLGLYGRGTEFYLKGFTEYINERYEALGKP